MPDYTAEEVEATGLIKFLKTTRSQGELKTALAIIEEFKELETEDGFMQPFSLWARLEQLEDYLRLLTGDGSENVTDDIAKEYFASIRGDLRKFP